MSESKVYYPLFLGIAIALGIGLGYLLRNGDSSDGLIASNAKKRKLNKLIDIIDQRYVDEVNTDSIVDVAVNGILSNLDPHSVYIASDEMEDVADQMRGDFVGIGIRFFVNQDTISVLNVLDGGPSKKAGIRGGDRLLYVDGKPLYGVDAVSTDVLKGEDGSKVVLGVLKPGDQDVLDVTVVRGNVPISSIEASYMLDESLGYIKVNRFAESTEEEFNNAIDELVKQGAAELIVDLRDNPGGVLSAAISMADEFLSRKKLILFQKDRNNDRKDSYSY